jgi:hypothetical protein
MDDLPRNHFLMHATIVQYAAAKGVPMPEVAVAVAGVLILIGGFCVLTGFQPYVGLSCIALLAVQPRRPASGPRLGHVAGGNRR